MAALAVALAAGAVAGCTMGASTGSLLVDSSRYTIYRCEDLAAELKTLAKREAELRALIAKASEGSGGTVIGALAYQSDLETVVQKQNVVGRLGAERHCQFVIINGSDQIIH